MSDTRPVADRGARDEALDPGRSFIVQAPAGSGKTGLLAQRYLRLLARVQAPEEVLAITFTNKAAAEMRARVIKALLAARGDEPEEAHERKTWTLAREVLKHDAQRGWQLERNPTRLRIRTIDSLCAALTRQMPLLSRFGAQPAITENAEPLYREAARNLLREIDTRSKWSERIAHLLSHLDNDHQKAEALFVTMFARRDQWLRHVADPDNPSLKRENLEAGLAHLVTDGLRSLAVAVPDDVTAELCWLARFAAGHVGAPDNAIACCRDMTALPRTEPDDVGMWQGLAELLLTKGGDWRRSATSAIGFPAPGGARDNAEKEQLKQAKERFVGLVDRCRHAEVFRRQLHGVRSLPPIGYDEEQWAVLQTLIGLLPLGVAHLRLVFTEAAEVDFVEVAQAASRALGAPEMPTDLALALDYRIHHILVDEFQDTSLSQYELLERLTAGWEPGDGRTLFLVGDPMQSIYRFREAEVGLYLRARRGSIGGVALVPLTLEVNFRSHQGIVDWVNETFARVLPEGEDIGAGAVPYTRSVPYSGPHQHEQVTFHPYLRKQPEVEASQVVTLVNEARRVDREGKIVILVRGRTHLLEIVPRLKRAGLKFRAIEIEPLASRQAVQDLWALTRALVHPADRVAWLALLRAPWCGLSLVDLEALVGPAPHRAVWDLMMDDEVVLRVSEDGRPRIKRVRGVLATSFGMRGRLSVRRWVEGAWLALGGPACVEDETDLADTQVFFEALDELDSGCGLDSLAELEERIERLYALPDTQATDALQVMTIHKAKGLEFDTVIVPGLGNLPQKDEQKLLMWLERPRSHEESDLLLAPLHGVGGDKDPVYQYLSRLSMDKARLEDGRLLYVAATRAKKRLHLLGHTGHGKKDGALTVKPPLAGSLLARLWPVVASEFERLPQEMAERAALDEENVDEKVSLPQGIFRLPLNWCLPEAPSAVDWHTLSAGRPPAEIEHVEFEWAGEAAKHMGTVVHRFLERIGSEGLDQWDLRRIEELTPVYRAQLLQVGVPASEVNALAGRVRSALVATLEHGRGRWILDPEHDAARSEYALTGVVDGEPVGVVIDRTFVDEDGTRWIIDYKSSVHIGGGLDAFLDRERERYRYQLERYARLMANVEKRPIRLGLYFPLLQGWREWRYENA